MRRFHWLVVSAVVPFLGCGAGAENERVASAPAATWSASLLGQPADVMFHVGVGQLLADPRYGPPLARAISSMGSLGTDDYPIVKIDDPRFYASTVIDVFAAVGPSIEDAKIRHVITVIRGVPNFDPRVLRSERGEADLSPNMRTFPSGVSEFLSGARASPFVLYVMPDHATWVVTDDVTAQRAGPYFWSHGSAPPSPPDDGSLAMLYLGPRTLGLAYVALSRRDVPADGIVGIQSAVVSLRPGRESAVLGRFSFDTDAHATGLAMLLDPATVCATDACRRTRADLAEAPTRAVQSGAGVETTTTLTDKLLGPLLSR